MRRLITTSSIVHSPLSKFLRCHCQDYSRRLNGTKRRSAGFAFAEVEQLESLAITPHALAQFIRGPMIELKTAAGEHDTVIFPRFCFAHQFARYVVAGAHRVALKWIAPTAAACGTENH